MIAWAQRRPAMAGMALLAVLLVVLIGFETGFGARLRTPIPQEPAKRAAAPEAKLLPPLAMVSPEQAYPETAARPLWVPTRRPAPVEAVDRPRFAKGQFILQGVIVVGDSRTAMLREKTSGKVHRVETGKELNGIKVEKIEPMEVTLAQGGEREVVALVVQKPGATTPGQPAAAADTGPFGAAAAPPPAAGQPAAANPAASALARPPTGRAAADPSQTSPAGRATFGPAGSNPGTPNTAQPGAAPMSPEELLARRRARRSQPTQ